MQRSELENQVFAAARDNGISSVLFRNALSRKLSLNVTDAECLSLLTIKGISTPSELSRYTGLTSGSTTAMLDRLEKRKFIFRKPNPNDRRGVLIEINPAYAAVSKPLVAGVQQAHRQSITKYSEEELQVIADFLRRFTQNVVEATGEMED